MKTEQVLKQDIHVRCLAERTPVIQQVTDKSRGIICDSTRKSPVTGCGFFSFGSVFQVRFGPCN